MIPYGRQSIDASDIAAVVAVLESDWLTQGPAISRFEDAVREWCGAAHASAVSNATTALHLACRALGLGPGGLLWTSPNTFVASANCARYCGADVDFVDIDPATFTMSVAALAAKLEAAERAGRLPQIVVPVHFAGQPCDMASIAKLARRYGFAVIEDAAHAIGAEHEGRRVGSCTHSDITVFSFHPVKIVTTGEGGMLLTNRADLHQRIVLLRSHGITRDPAQMQGPAEGAWYYEQIELGYNYRMTDLQAALGASQMARLPAFLARRRGLAQRYRDAFTGWPIATQAQPAYALSAWHLFPVLIDPARCGRDRRTVFDTLRAAGIGVNVHYIPVHTQPDFQGIGFRRGDFPQAESYYHQTLSLPLHAELSDAQQDQVIDALAAALDTPGHGR